MARISLIFFFCFDYWILVSPRAHVACVERLREENVELRCANPLRLVRRVALTAVAHLLERILALAMEVPGDGRWVS